MKSRIRSAIPKKIIGINISSQKRDIIEDIAGVPLLSGVMDNEDANAVVIGELFQAGQILVVLGVGIDLCGNVVPYHLKSINE